jgi:hypothetical protein
MRFDGSVVPKMMQSALERSRTYFSDELGIEILSATPSLSEVETLALHDVTSIIGLRGSGVKYCKMAFCNVA